MPELARLLIISNLAQAAAALLLGALLLSFHRDDGRPYVRHWALSWMAFTVYLAASAAALSLIRGMAATHPVRLALTFGSLFAAYLQVGWLLAGAWEMRSERGVSPGRMRWLLPAAAMIALVCTVAFLTPREAFSQRHFVRVGVRAAALGAALLAGAYMVWPGGEGEGRTGRRMVAVGFVLFAGEQGAYFTLALRGLWGYNPPPSAAYLGTVDFLLQWVIGLGMVLVLLEQQRAGAVRSARDAERLAYHDPLTGLPNRRLLRERLDGALAAVRRGGGHVGVVFVDLDRFKVINDSLGHAAGDDLLREAGTRLRGAVRETDTVARLGGDEFVLLLTALPDPAAAGTVAGKALDALRPPFSIAGHELFVTASAGVTVAPGDGQSTETLVRQADMAMYQAKQSPAGALRFFSPEMNLAARARLDTESALRRALARDELVLAYQPVVEVATGRVAGVEALVRWRHPERGLLPPSEFLDVAEATGLIVPMGAWVLRTACERARHWQQAGLGEPRLLVNLSVRQFLEPGLVDLVRAAVADAGLPPERLELEITESMAMADVAASEAVLRALNEAGVRLSIDDFGTGYSSFEYLRRFPIDTLKVDRGFVGGVETDPGDAAIVAAVIAMSHRLGLSVVGEGVETPGQLRFLREQGCDAVQGYLIARPMLGDEMDDYLRRTGAAGALAGVCAVDGQRGPAISL